MIMTDLAFGYFEYETYAKYFMFATEQPVTSDFDKFRREYFNFFGFKTDYGLPSALKQKSILFYANLSVTPQLDDTQFFTYINNWTQTFRTLCKTYYIPEAQLMRSWFHLKTALCVACPKLTYFADKSYKEFEEIQRTHRVLGDYAKQLNLGTGIIVRNDRIEIIFFSLLSHNNPNLIEHTLAVNWNIKTELGSLDQTYGMLQAFISNPIISDVHSEQDKYVHDMWNSITQLFQ
jgi:hypothetical protein